LDSSHCFHPSSHIIFHETPLVPIQPANIADYRDYNRDLYELVRGQAETGP
jgi:hypothetical protein